jgi:CheY-like chemotaxis protein
MGARSVLAKPIKNADLLTGVFHAIHRDLEERQRALLLVAPEAERATLRDALALDGVEIVEAADTGAAAEMALTRPFECVIVGADHDAAAVLAAAERLSGRLPDQTILLHMPQPPGKRDEPTLRHLLATGRVQQVQSVERLLDAVLLRLDWPLSEVPPERSGAVAALYDNDTVLAGRRVLIVDDDIRNIFALTSVLEREQMIVLPAETGKGAIELLQRSPDVDIVLMDIMMPGMDGYETMRAIRKMKGLRHLPIIAVTAKAMKGDREKTIEAGAWDYLSKPVDSNQMLAVMRAWLRR